LYYSVISFRFGFAFMPLPEGNRPHNLDLSSLTPLPNKREVGRGVKKSESQGLPEAKITDVGAPDAREAKPSQPNPAEQQAGERLGQQQPTAFPQDSSLQGSDSQTPLVDQLILKASRDMSKQKWRGLEDIQPSDDECG
jgi:hypothetical protein